GSRGLDVVQQNGFDDVTIQRFQSPFFRGDTSGNKVVPNRAQGKSARVEPAEVAGAIPAASHDEGDEQEYAQQRKEDGLQHHPGYRTELRDQPKNEIHSSTRNCSGFGSASDTERPWSR